MQRMAPMSSYQYSEPYKRNTIHDLMHQIWEEQSLDHEDRCKGCTEDDLQTPGNRKSMKKRRLNSLT